ncbi:MAG: glycoside hydrolase family 27 protein [Armatimonadetes bacterium]|nr:glycoside hydrolase family 27 protein [Armatimonadota bacterium]MDE2206399.1 glycoside hydrolase family 27 protein [Armatimonadota bacterium]
MAAHRAQALLAHRPPMGWNSWDCFGLGVREWAVRANTDAMAGSLAGLGWEYIVVDEGWYNPTGGTAGYSEKAAMDMDGFGRFIPSFNRFPSAGHQAGFKPLADYVHRNGLKFGIHIMRGIPRQAVAAKTPIFGSTAHAQDIADPTSICDWNSVMYGVHPELPGSQDWYNSLITLYNAWGVDFIKADDMSQPYHQGEIRLLHNAIEKVAPGIVLSLSPGPTPLSRASDVAHQAEMWRISDDVWDQWDHVLRAFDLLPNWVRYGGPGHWPDADMLPLGRIALPPQESDKGGRASKLTHDEQLTMMTLWIIARSPLMFGGHLPALDRFTLGLLTNTEALRIQQQGAAPGQIDRTFNLVRWLSNAPDGSRYVALFNLDHSGLTVTENLTEFNVPLPCDVRDVWAQKSLGRPYNTLKLEIPPHGVRLLKLSSAI